MTMKRSGPTKVSDVVSTLLARRRRVPAYQREAEALRVFETFRRLGPPIDRHARAVAFRQGVLTVAVRDAAWLTELSFLKEQILERLNAGHRKKPVRDVRLRHMPLPAEEKPPEPPPLTPEARCKVEAWVANIGNPEVKNAVRRAAESALRSRRPAGASGSGPPGPLPGPGLSAAPSSAAWPRRKSGRGRG